MAIRHLDHVHLLFNVSPFVVLQACDLNFVVEVTDVANNRHVLHRAHVLDADHVLVACCRDENVRRLNSVLKCNNFKAVHRRLQCARSDQLR